MKKSTTKIWDDFRKAFETDIALYAGTCINSTEGGALIHGTEIMDLRDFL